METREPSSIHPQAAAPQSEQLLTTEEAARLLRIAPSTLVTWRCTGKVRVPYVQLGHAVRYRLSDLQRFLDARSTAGS